MTALAAQPEMIIGAISPWFGGKRTLAPLIVGEMGKHKAYWELCCGSLAVLLAKGRARCETVVDLHGDVTNLALVLGDESASLELYTRAYRTIFSEGIYCRARDVINATDVRPDELDRAASIERAYWYLVFSWMGRNGNAGMADTLADDFCVRYTTKGGDPGQRWRSVTASIPPWHERLRGVTVLTRDIFEVLPHIEDDDGVVIYVDPPYLKKAKGYKHDFKDGFMGAPNDHERLAEGLARFRKTRVVVSYYEHPGLASLYPSPRWHRRHVTINKATANQVARDRTGGTEAPEVLLINGPSYAKESLA